MSVSRFNNSKTNIFSYNATRSSLGGQFQQTPLLAESCSTKETPLPNFKSKSSDNLVMSLTATAGSDVFQSGRPIFDDIFQHLWPYIGNNTANDVFQMVKRLWLIRIDQ
ncbi:hypothetical protein TNCV_1833231 [Trichonephila clavipes]|nr:hypothetical protein TNCV_1833231 [Trichonephila clavipes]